MRTSDVLSYYYAVEYRGWLNVGSVLGLVAIIVSSSLLE